MSPYQETDENGWSWQLSEPNAGKAICLACQTYQLSAVELVAEKVPAYLLDAPWLLHGSQTGILSMCSKCFHRLSFYLKGVPRSTVKELHILQIGKERNFSG